mmetsp:Transcript_59054/g.137498  ORF Transcript_59054/g.137498 Transcript_59054/m.137498 type:complete len:230 (-) Transcript_59054:49-738(-)
MQNISVEDEGIAPKQVWTPYLHGRHACEVVHAFVGVLLETQFASRNLVSATLLHGVAHRVAAEEKLKRLGRICQGNPDADDPRAAGSRVGVPSVPLNFRLLCPAPDRRLRHDNRRKGLGQAHGRKGDFTERRIAEQSSGATVVEPTPLIQDRLFKGHIRMFPDHIPQQRHKRPVCPQHAPQQHHSITFQCLHLAGIESSVREASQARSELRWFWHSWPPSSLQRRECGS